MADVNARGSDHRILTGAEMAAADAAALAAGATTLELIERAGEAVCAAILARWTPRPVLALCGAGNNGADGFVAARRLAEAGWPVRVAVQTEPRAMKGAAREAALRWTGATRHLAEAAPGEANTGEAALVIDALLGAGLTRPLHGGVLSALRGAQAAGAPIVAVDLPSGLPADTGQPLGYAPQAALTVSFHRKKPAHVLEPGRSLCGEIVIADIGLAAPATVSTNLCENDPDLWLHAYPWPRTDTYKTERGRLIVVSGHAWSTGAARMSARAGLRIGAGLVTLLSPPDALAVNAAHLEAVMLKPFETDADLQHAADQADVAVIGPGAGVSPQTRQAFTALARTGAALVVDADVFSVFRDQPNDLFAALDRDDVLTPHPGEFERVFPGLLKSCPERISATRQAARRADAVVVLKGADTVIAAPDGRAVVNTNAAPWLATAGAGDVLAGFAAGLMAQGMGSFEAACAAVWIHAEAGRTFGPGLIAEDLPDRAPAILSALKAHSDAAQDRAGRPGPRRD